MPEEHEVKLAVLIEQVKNMEVRINTLQTQHEKKLDRIDSGMGWAAKLVVGFVIYAVLGGVTL